MGLGRLCAGASLTAFLSLVSPPLQAASGPLDERGVSWAYGTIVDSVTVSGNKHTRSFVVLREMETQPGEVLDRSTLVRDIRFLNDLTPFSGVEVKADSLSPGRCALRIRVRERSEIFIKAILPQFRYDFERGFTYGIRWNNYNFRGRLEQLSVSYSRNGHGDESSSLGWATPWVGWKHVALGGGIAYYKRGDEPHEIEVLERFGAVGYVGIPLTESRVTFSQLLLSLGMDQSRTGGQLENPETGEVGEKQTSISPLVGYRFDNRDTPLKPTRGWLFNTSLRATYPIEGGRDSYYLCFNEVRHFVALGDKAVIGLLSHLDYQFGDFPNYSYLRLGGASSLRGQPFGRFKGHHRWFQTVEWRYQILPRKVFRLPIVREFDVGLGFVTFVDTGIVWNEPGDFTLENFHGTGGVGLQFFSPISDVIRFDFGFNLHGAYRFHTDTGVRF